MRNHRMLQLDAVRYHHGQIHILDDVNAMLPQIRHKGFHRSYLMVNVVAAVVHDDVERAYLFRKRNQFPYACLIESESLYAVFFEHGFRQDVDSIDHCKWEISAPQDRKSVV